MKIGNLRHRVEIQSKADVPDGSVGITEGWSTVATVWADVRHAQGFKAYDDYPTDTPQPITHSIFIRYRADVTTKNWVLWDSRHFRIRRVKNLDGRARFLELECEEVTPEGAYS